MFTEENDSIIPEPKNLFMRDLVSDGLLNMDINDEKVRQKLENINTSKVQD